MAALSRGLAALASQVALSVSKCVPLQKIGKALTVRGWQSLHTDHCYLECGHETCTVLRGGRIAPCLLSGQGDVGFLQSTAVAMIFSA